MKIFNLLVTHIIWYVLPGAKACCWHFIGEEGQLTSSVDQTQIFSFSLKTKPGNSVELCQCILYAIVEYIGI